MKRILLATLTGVVLTSVQAFAVMPTIPQIQRSSQALMLRVVPVQTLEQAEQKMQTENTEYLNGKAAYDNARSAYIIKRSECRNTEIKVVQISEKCGTRPGRECEDYLVNSCVGPLKNAYEAEKTKLLRALNELKNAAESVKSAMARAQQAQSCGD